MNWKHILSTLGSGFATGALGFLSAHLSGGVPTTTQGLEAFAAGAALGGLVAVWHLYQPAPGSPQATVSTAALNAVETEAAKLGVPK